MSFFEFVPWWIWFVIGFIVGVIIAVTFEQRPKDGVIHVTEKGDSENLLFEFNIPPEKIPQMKNVNFKVQIEEDPSKNLQAP